MDAPKNQPTLLKSSNLHSAQYDPSTAVLEIQFRSGGLYQYLNVPKRIFDDLLEAPSKGQYFHQHIKNIFTFRKAAQRPKDAPAKSSVLRQPRSKA